MADILGEIIMYRGDSFPIEITLKSAGIVIDITGYSFLLTVASTVNPTDDTTKIFDITGTLDSDPTTGKVSFTPTINDTNQEIKIYYYDIQMTDNSGNIRTVAKDKFAIRQDITK